MSETKVGPEKPTATFAQGLIRGAPRVGPYVIKPPIVTVNVAHKTHQGGWWVGWYHVLQVSGRSLEMQLPSKKTITPQGIPGFNQADPPIHGEETLAIP